MTGRTLVSTAVAFVAAFTVAGAAALQTARAAVREGDIFTREVAALLRTRVSEALAARGFLPEEMVAGTLEEADEEAPLPVVNGRFAVR